MTSEDRKAAIGAYRKRKIAAGVYVVRCTPTGEVWVGRAPDLSTIQNRLWFTLRGGNSTHRSLQNAWRASGAEAFTFEILECLEEEENDYVRDRSLQALHMHWMEKLKATRI